MHESGCLQISIFVARAAPIPCAAYRHGENLFLLHCSCSGLEIARCPGVLCVHHGFVIVFTSCNAILNAAERQIFMAHANGRSRCRPALQRLIAVACALAFLLVGITHTLSHYSATDIANSCQVGTSSSNDVNDCSKTVPLAADHCHICAPVVMPILAATAASETVVATLQPALVREMRAHDPTFTTPPPKSST